MKGRPRIDIRGQRFGMLVACERMNDPKTGYNNLWLCLCDCGSHKITSTGSLRSGKQKSCGCRPKSGPNNGRWNGGRFKTAQGYIRIWKPDHSRANAVGYVLEHLLVMESIVGRPIDISEEIHHKNGIRDDNRPENLELWARSQPPGQRVEDLIEFSILTLRKYRPHLLR